ncbi:MAG: hypothetical protein AAB316_16145 [Bacteroidota bacterium]
MKLLLDENLPRKLKSEFGAAHQVFTVSDMKWTGIKNGELLGLLVMHGFDALVTIDKNLQFQQNLAKFPIRLFVLDAPSNKIPVLKPYIQNLLLRLPQLPTEQVLVVQV